jgi:hypothetical protein
MAQRPETPSECDARREPEAAVLRRSMISKQMSASLGYETTLNITNYI